MSYGLSKTSGLSICYLEGKDPFYKSNTDIDFKYDRTQLPVDFGVTSSDDISFNFSQGSSYILLANVYWIHITRYGSMQFSYGFYNEDTSSFIGSPGSLSLYLSNDTDPLYTRNASAMLFSNNIPSSGTNISLKFKQIIGPSNDNDLNPTLGRTKGTFEGENIFSTKPLTVKPTFTIIKNG